MVLNLSPGWAFSSYNLRFAMEGTRGDLRALDFLRDTRPRERLCGLRRRHDDALRPERARDATRALRGGLREVVDPRQDPHVPEPRAPDRLQVLRLLRRAADAVRPQLLVQPAHRPDVLPHDDVRELEPPARLQDAVDLP